MLIYYIYLFFFTETLLFLLFVTDNQIQLTKTVNTSCSSSIAIDDENSDILRGIKLPQKAKRYGKTKGLGETTIRKRKPNNEKFNKKKQKLEKQTCITQYLEN